MATGLDFTTLPRVRRACSFPVDDVSKDALLTELIKGVSAQAELELRRSAKQVERTEILQLWPPNRVLRLSGYPVLDTPAPVVKASNERDFVTSPADLTRGTDFVLENESGVIRMMTELRGWRDATGWVIGPSYVQVVYTGGMGANTAEFITAFPELAGAIDIQIAYEFKRMNSPGGNIIVGPNSSNYEQSYDWLPHVRRILHGLKRRQVY